MARLRVSEVLAQRGVVFNVTQEEHLPARECPPENIARWKSQIAPKPVVHHVYVQSSWSSVALEAAHATIKAFKMAQIPLLLTWGTLLGWYRQCDIIENTGDVDFNVPMDYIVNQEHYLLLKVWFSPLS